MNHDKAYDFNLKSHKPKQDGELLVDLKIDGKRGPIPKIVKGKMGKVFVDGEGKIKEFDMPVDQMSKVIDLKEISVDEKDKKEKKDKKEMAQILQESSSP